MLHTQAEMLACESVGPAVSRRGYCVEVKSNGVVKKGYASEWNRMKESEL